MKRYFCMSVVFALCLIVVGCRRGSATPRGAVKLPDENILLKGPKEVEMQFAARPADRKFKLVVESLYKVDADKNLGEAARKKLLGDAAKAQDEMEKDNASRERLQQLTELAAQEQLEFEFAPFGQAANRYLELKKTNMPKEYVELEFYKWLRREELKVPRKYLDRVAIEIVHEPIDLNKFLGKDFTFITDVDMNGKAGDYIVAYGSNIYQANGEKTFKRADQKLIEKALDQQELRLVRHYFAGYCGPLHIRAAVDKKEGDLLFATLGYRNQGDIVDKMQYTSPAAVIARFESEMPQFVINPPSPVDLEKFAIHLRDKAPPSLKNPLEDRVISLNKDVNWRNPADIVACRTVYDEVEDPKTKQKFILGHLSVNTVGNVNYAAPAQVQRFLQKAPEKGSGRRGGGGMMGGGMPGMGRMP